MSVSLDAGQANRPTGVPIIPVLFINTTCSADSSLRAHYWSPYIQIRSLHRLESDGSTPSRYLKIDSSMGGALFSFFFYT
jgi:hypothetical protein